MGSVGWIVGMDLCWEVIVSFEDGGIGRSVGHLGSRVRH